MTVHKSKGLEFPSRHTDRNGKRAYGPGAQAAEASYTRILRSVCLMSIRDEKWHRKTLLQRVIEAQKAE